MLDCWYSNPFSLKAFFAASCKPARLLFQGSLILWEAPGLQNPPRARRADGVLNHSLHGEAHAELPSAVMHALHACLERSSIRGTTNQGSPKQQDLQHLPCENHHSGASCSQNLTPRTRRCPKDCKKWGPQNSLGGLGGALGASWRLFGRPRGASKRSWSVPRRLLGPLLAKNVVQGALGGRPGSIFVDFGNPGPSKS